MDLGQRYDALCRELGHLDSELAIREERRAAIRAEMKVLKRLAVIIDKEAAHAAPPAPVDAAPDSSAP